MIPNSIPVGSEEMFVSTDFSELFYVPKGGIIALCQVVGVGALEGSGNPNLVNAKIDMDGSDVSFVFGDGDVFTLYNQEQIKAFSIALFNEEHTAQVSLRVHYYNEI